MSKRETKYKLKEQSYIVDGYVRVLRPDHPLSQKNGYILLSRLIASEKWGIEAVKGKIVHHKNGIKTDNRIENLEVISQSDHVRLHKFGKYFGDSKLENAILITFNIDKRIKREITKIAKARGVSISAIIRQVLAECIEKNRE